jgi:hypothetical protein
VKVQVLHGLHLLAGQGAHLWPPGAVEAIVDVALNTPYQKVLSWSLDVLQVLAKSTATCHSQLHPGKSFDESSNLVYVAFLYVILRVCNCVFILLFPNFLTDYFLQDLWFLQWRC